ncbi:hypothetical protein I302_101312 [Kwoniella bestiolae CBS 10118]|uniref:Uncharacterized protein n=1 Tax=Kwoniella bestiolae CBS 10118 TaxID=1296100 RepID=A0A1B9G7I2_9TREE|nr:hypothetical protein I302_04686 [Kwoniella bestiolae CBS 10118]OCF26994.1 hypothetical protein I302_04686 [Kwoniella bestiolae CBS 10118]
MVVHKPLRKSVRLERSAATEAHRRQKATFNHSMRRKRVDPKGDPKVIEFEMKKKDQHHEASYKLEYPRGEPIWRVWWKIDDMGLRGEVTRYWKVVEGKRGLTPIQKKVRRQGYW